MLSLPFGARRWPIALDIGSDSIKMVQMVREGSAVRVFACGRRRLPDRLCQDSKRRQELAAGAVRDMLRTGGFRGSKVVAALSCGQLLIKNVRLPHMPEQELGQAVQWEAKERFGFDVAPDQLAYINAGQVRTGNETRDEIILLAARQEAVDELLELLDQAGLFPVGIGAEPVALFRGFERFLRRRADEQAVSIIVDMGQAGTRVVVARGRQVVFMKHIEIGGRRFSEAVARQLELSYHEAADLRLRLTGEQHEEQPKGPGEPVPARPSQVNWTIHDAVRGEVESLAKEISLCLRYCSVTFRGLRPECITLTGGEAYDQAVVELLSEQLGMRCVPGNPLRGVDVSGVDLGANRRGMMGEWAVCAGLAFDCADVSYPAQEGEHGENRLSA